MGRNRMKKNIGLTAIIGASMMLTACPKKTDEASVVSGGKKLYVASGTCSAGNGNTTYVQSATANAIMSYDAVTGEFNKIELAMSQIMPVDVNTTPVQIINRESDLLLLTENATQQIHRRILKVPKSAPTTYTVFFDDGDVFVATAANILRSFTYDATDGTAQVSKSTLADKILPQNVRATKGGTNWFLTSATTAATCMPAAAANINFIDTIPPFSTGVDGKTIMMHTGATANANRLFAVSRTGYATAAADCNSITASSPASVNGLQSVAHVNGPGLTGPVSFLANGINAIAVVKIATSTVGQYKLIVAYSNQTAVFDNNTNFSAGLVMWDMNETSDTNVNFVNPVIIYRNVNVVWAPSALTYDPSTSELYVAVGGAPGATSQTAGNYGYNIEKFRVDFAAVAPATILTRIHKDNKPFFAGNQNTKCISSLAIE